MFCERTIVAGTQRGGGGFYMSRPRGPWFHNLSMLMTGQGTEALPGQAEASMGNAFLSSSFRWKRWINSLWLSNRLKLRLKLVSNT